MNAPVPDITATVQSCPAECNAAQNTEIPTKLRCSFIFGIKHTAQSPRYEAAAPPNDTAKDTGPPNIMPARRTRQRDIAAASIGDKAKKVTVVTIFANPGFTPGSTDGISGIICSAYESANAAQINAASTHSLRVLSTRFTVCSSFPEHTHRHACRQADNALFCLRYWCMSGAYAASTVRFHHSRRTVFNFQSKCVPAGLTLYSPSAERL